MSFLFAGLSLGGGSKPPPALAAGESGLSSTSGGDGKKKKKKKGKRKPTRVAQALAGGDLSDDSDEEDVVDIIATQRVLLTQAQQSDKETGQASKLLLNAYVSNHMGKTILDTLVHFLYLHDRRQTPRQGVAIPQHHK